MTTPPSFSRTGLMADLAGGGPLVPIGGIGDHSVAVALVGGICAACTAAPSPTLATRWTCPCISPAFSFSAPAFSTALTAACYPEPGWTAGHAGSNTYQGSDGEWFYLACIDYRRFPELCQLIGHPELAEDPKYSTNTAYYANRTELTKIFDEIFNKQPVSYWNELFNEHDMPHEVLRHFKDVPYDLQAQVNHYTYFHEYPDGTKTVFTNGPVHFASVDPANIPCRVSGAIGRDTAQVLEALGYSVEKKSPPCTKPRRSDKPSISNSHSFLRSRPGSGSAEKPELGRNKLGNMENQICEEGF